MWGKCAAASFDALVLRQAAWRDKQTFQEFQVVLSAQVQDTTENCKPTWQINASSQAWGRVPARPAGFSKQLSRARLLTKRQLWHRAAQKVLESLRMGHDRDQSHGLLWNESGLAASRCEPRIPMATRVHSDPSRGCFDLVDALCLVFVHKQAGLLTNGTALG